MTDYPEDLDRPLTRGDASLLGVGWRELAGPLWRSPYRGVHVWSVTDPEDPQQRALDAAGLLPSAGALGGWAAARVGGVVELDGRSDGLRLPVPLCLPPGLSRRRGRAISVWHSPLHPDDVTEVGGIRVTVPVRTAFDLARTGPLVHSVVALDLLSRGRPEFLCRVREYLSMRPRWRGVVQARRALELVSPRTLSVRETELRLLWMLECNLPQPEVNARVFDSLGNLLGMADLLDPETGMIAEYDGAGHRQEVQHALDNAREEGLEDNGLTVVRVSHPDLGRFRRRTRERLLNGSRRAKTAPRGSWCWQPGPMPEPVPLW